VRTFSAVKGKVGEVVEIGLESLRITCQGGQIEVFKAKGEETKKLPAPELALAIGLHTGSLLG